MNTVFQLLTELSTDPFRLDDFLHDPDPLGAGSGIAPEDLPLLMRSSELAPDGTWSHCATLADPGHDPLPDPDVPYPDDDPCPEESSPPEKA